MTTGELLLRRICLAPEDTDVRLVYADWCEECGDVARSEFIRVQIELARMRQNKPSGTTVALNRSQQMEWQERAAELRRRERELWARAADEAMQLDEPLWGLPLDWHITGWSPNRLHLVDTANEMHPEMWVEFRRGFIEQVSATATLWLAHGAAIVAACPVTRCVLTDKRSVLGSYSSQHWAWFKWVEDSVEEDVIPSPLWDVLPNGVDEMLLDAGVKLYTSEQAAIDALSTAAITWARREAGL